MSGRFLRRWACRGGNLGRGFYIREAWWLEVSVAFLVVEGRYPSSCLVQVWPRSKSGISRDYRMHLRNSSQDLKLNSKEGFLGNVSRFLDEEKNL